MKKQFVIVIGIFFSFNLFAQMQYKEFLLRKQDTIVANSLYNKIQIVDSRIDTSHMGIVQVGAMNNHAKVIAALPIETQLNDFISSVIDSNALSGSLLLQIRQLLFAESTKMTSEKGYCSFEANLYARKDACYGKLASIDTLVMVKSMDVTSGLLKKGSSLITNLIIDNLKTQPSGDISLTYDEIIKVDSIEKSKIELYTLKSYTEGLYYTYESFKNQIPDKSVIVKRKKGVGIVSVQIKDENNNLIKMKGEDFYAFVSEGKPYISTGYGYYPIHRNEGNFYFIGEVRPNTTNGSNVAAAGIMFGMIGMIIASNSAPGERYFVILDHRTGGFVLVKKMPDPPNQF